jgi:glutamyl-tRNA reductase
MTVWTLGINHQTAPLDVRGRMAFGVDQIGPLVGVLKEKLTSATRIGAQPVEAALVSTCNRTEIYAAAEQPAFDAALHWLADHGGLTANDLSRHTYALTGDQAARHVFRVASGLDSMVLGEPQILGQMKEAVRAASQAGALGTDLNQLFQRSFSVAKEVRTSTRIGEQSISMAAATVRLASNLFEDLADIHVLFVGAGEMIELSATHFAAKTPKSMAVANRSLEKGEHLAARFGASSMRLADLPQRLHEFDAVISCTASTLPLIGLGAVERALKKRKHRPMLMVDLAVPRDIEPEVKELDDVYLYTVDDLARVVQTGHAHRQAAMAEAEVIIDAGVQSFMHWLDQRANVPLIQRLHQQANEWQQLEIERAKRCLAKGGSPEEALEMLAKGLSQKMLHGAFAELHGRAEPTTSTPGDTIARLFLRKER